MARQIARNAPTALITKRIGYLGVNTDMNARNFENFAMDYARSQRIAISAFSEKRQPNPYWRVVSTQLPPVRPAQLQASKVCR